MSTRLTIFTATLVQDSALSVSGIDRETSSDQPLAMVDGKPMLVGRGLKGACVAMAKRFFDPLPRAVSDDINNGALRRSAWEFEDATTVGTPQLRAGVGIRHKTGARAEGVLYDREVIPARTRWDLRFRVDWSFALNEDEAKEAEGILGYVLQEHWAQGRCWLGGGAARGLGWCTIKYLKAWQLDDDSYVKWVNTGRPVPPELTAMSKVPIVQPTRAWSFRTLDLQVTCGEYKPNPDEAAWGLDMLAVGPHEGESSIQTTGDGTWATPAWVENTNVPKELVTDRSILMDGSRPLLPGSSVRGPLRHAFSRSRRVDGKDVADPHLDPEKVAPEDEGGKLFGTVDRSSRVLICDVRAEGDWSAAKMHMHAEDEFSAGSYGSAKRDAVRMLRGEFPVRIVVEGEDPKATEDMVNQLDQEIALGELGHLPIGGHKTRGAGGGRWKAGTWTHDYVQKDLDWKQPE